MNNEYLTARKERLAEVNITVRTFCEDLIEAGFDVRIYASNVGEKLRGAIVKKDEKLCGFELRELPWHWAISTFHKPNKEAGFSITVKKYDYKRKIMPITIDDIKAALTPSIEVINLESFKNYISYLDFIELEEAQNGD